jgi:hypothetical protein
MCVSAWSIFTARPLRVGARARARGGVRALVKGTGQRRARGWGNSSLIHRATLTGTAPPFQRGAPKSATLAVTPRPSEPALFSMMLRAWWWGVGVVRGRGRVRRGAPRGRPPAAAPAPAEAAPQRAQRPRRALHLEVRVQHVLAVEVVHRCGDVDGGVQHSAVVDTGWGGVVARLGVWGLGSGQGAGARRRCQTLLGILQGTTTTAAAAAAAARTHLPS